jgi:Ca2+-binding EF-hand superfamily protein
MDLVPDTDETVKAYDDNDDGLIHYGEFFRNHQKALKAAAETAPL